MKKMLATILLALTVPAVASAQRSISDDCAAQRKKTGVCELDFIGDKLTGEVARPDGEGGSGRPDTKHPSLIRYRKEFTLRIVASAEDRK